nr:MULTISPECIES: CRISPR-associated endonuclease Cas1 [unclassified Bradyrhizobium]
MNKLSSTGSIFDRLCRHVSLLAGWERTWRNAGGPGGDGVTLQQFEAALDDEITRLCRDLALGFYAPGPCRHLAIPKHDGGARPLSIPCVRDRVAQSALHLLLQPLLDPQLSPTSFAYRPHRSIDQAVRAIETARADGFTHVVDADIERFFENVPHDKLLGRLGVLLAENAVLQLITVWLETGSRTHGRGLAQGAPISPLLANLYLDELDRSIQSDAARVVRFADDFLVLCRTEAAAHAMLPRIAGVLTDLGLRLNAEKTRVVDFDNGFHFLGRVFVHAAAFIAHEAEAQLTTESTRLEHDDLTLQDPAWPSIAEDIDDPFHLVPEDADGMVDPETADAPAPAPLTDLAPIIRPLYLTTPGRRLDLQGEAFAVHEQERVVFAAVPARIDRIEVGPETEVSAAAMRHALLHEIPLVFVSTTGAPHGDLAATPARHGDIHLAQAQMVLDPAASLAHAAAVVRGRIRNQRALLFRLNRKRGDAETRRVASYLGRIALKLDVATTIDVVRGIEGQAGAEFWPAYGRMLPVDFTIATRRRNEGATRTDVLLDFAAHLITREVETLVRRHGLHPGFGILHVVRRKSGPLAWDLVEAFRAPLIEGFVGYVLNNRILVADHFTWSESTGFRLLAEGRDRFIRAYEQWLNRPVRNPRRKTDSIWRRLVDDDVLAFREAVLGGPAFVPYTMDY